VVKTIKTVLYQVTEHSQIIALSLEIPWNVVRTWSLIQIDYSMYIKLDIFSHQYEAEVMTRQDDETSETAVAYPKNRWEDIEAKQIYSIEQRKPSANRNILRVQRLPREVQAEELHKSRRSAQ
jgi:hypothetical protein